MFEQEVEFALDLKPLKVHAIEKLTRNGCPYLEIVGTRQRVNFMPAKGFKKSGLFIAYFTNPVERPSNFKLDGVFDRHQIKHLIRIFGMTKPRNLRNALEFLDMIPKRIVNNERNE